MTATALKWRQQWVCRSAVYTLSGSLVPQYARNTHGVGVPSIEGNPEYYPGGDEQ